MLLFKYVSGAMGLVIIALLLMLAGEKRHSAKVERQLAKATAELTRISTERDEQRAETGKNIAQAEREIVYVDRYIRPLESRPIGDNPKCETPDVSEWRGVL